MCADGWSLYAAYLDSNAHFINDTLVTFNSTMHVQHDFSYHLEILFNASVGDSLGLNSIDDCWEYIGRYFYIHLWLQLSDLGQISFTADPANDTLYAFSEADNIFVNQSLYENYLEWIGFNGSDFPPMAVNLTFTPFLPVDIESYICQQRQLKSAINLLISVIAADYPFIVGGYALIALVAGALQRRQNEGE